MNAQKSPIARAYLQIFRKKNKDGSQHQPKRCGPGPHQHRGNDNLNRAKREDGPSGLRVKFDWTVETGKKLAREYGLCKNGK